MPADSGREVPPRLNPRALAVVSSLVSTAVAGVTALLFLGGVPPVPQTTEPAVIAVVMLVTGALLVVAGWLSALPQPHVSIGLAVSATGLLVPAWAASPAVVDQVRAWCLAAWPLIGAGSVLVATAWHPPRQSRAAARLAVAGLLVAAGLQLLGYDPARHPSCTVTCWPAGAPIADALGPRASFGVVVLMLVASSVVGVAAVAQSRRTPMVLRVGATASVLLVALVYADVWWRWREMSRPAWWTWALVAAALALAVPASAAVVRAALTRERLRVLADRLGDPVPALATAAGVRAIQLRVPGEDDWVDPEGAPVTAATGGVVLSDADGPAVRLLLAPNRDPTIAAAALNPVTVMALDNVRLDASCRYRYRQVLESQRRIIEASDAERHRIERDLHDGVQQPLVAAALQLQHAAERADASMVTALAPVSERVRGVLDVLRELSRGLYPAVLAQEGLEAAIEELAAESPLSVDVDVEPMPALPSSAVGAGYVAVASGLAAIESRPTATRAHVAAWARSGVVTVSVSDVDGRALGSADLTALRDRVGASEGTVTVVDGGARLEVVLPCE